MAYKLLTASSAEELADLVNEYLARSWQLVGGPVCVDGVFIQAVTHDHPPASTIETPAGKLELKGGQHG